MNTRRGPLADPALRRAIDGAPLVRAGVRATGAFAARFPFAAEAVTPHTPAAAAAGAGSGRRVDGYDRDKPPG